MIALRSEADRRGPVPRRTDAADEARLERLAAELEGSPRRSRTTSTTAPTTGRPGTSWPARAARRPRPTGREAVRLWQADLRPREEAYCLLASAECHAAEKRREKAAAAAAAARVIAERLGATPILVAVDDLLARTRLSVTPIPGNRSRAGPTA